MFVKMLTSMAGDSFSYRHGEVVTVKNPIGNAWIKAGIAEAVPDAVAVKKQAASIEAENARLAARLAESEADCAALREQIKASTDLIADLTGKLAASEADCAALTEEVTDLTAKLAAPETGQGGG